MTAYTAGGGDSSAADWYRRPARPNGVERWTGCAGSEWWKNRRLPRGGDPEAAGAVDQSCGSHKSSNCSTAGTSFERHHPPTVPDLLRARLALVSNHETSPATRNRPPADVAVIATRTASHHSLTLSVRRREDLYRTPNAPCNLLERQRFSRLLSGRPRMSLQARVASSESTGTFCARVFLWPCFNLTQTTTSTSKYGPLLNARL